MAAAQGQGESGASRMGDGLIALSSSPLRPALAQQRIPRDSVSWRPAPPHPTQPGSEDGLSQTTSHTPQREGRECEHAAPSCRGMLRWLLERIRSPARGAWVGRPAWVVPGSGSSPAADPDHRVIEKHRWPLQRSQSPFSPADCNQHLIHTPLFTNFPGGIMLMKGARQSSSLPEVGKRRGEEERAAARKKRGVGHARLGEGTGEPNGGLLGFTLPHCQPCFPSWCSCEERDAVTCWAITAEAQVL